jgi:hypothetical protein
MITPRLIALVMLASIGLVASALPSPRTSSQQTQTSSQPTQSATDQDIDLLRKDIRSQKKQMIAANLKLTDKEAEQFWPLYDQYTAELVKVNNAKYASIKEFAQNFDTLTDDQAANLTQQLLEVDASVAQLRIKYIPIFRKVISGKKTALFFQLDHRLVMLIDLQLASQIPLVEP